MNRQLLREKDIKKNIILSIENKPHIIHDLKRCLICNKLRINDDYTELRWQSNFILNVPSFHDSCDVFTICPSCRMKPINTIYEYLIKRMMKNLK